MTRWNGEPLYQPSFTNLMKLSRCLGVSLYSFAFMVPMLVLMTTTVSFSAFCAVQVSPAMIKAAKISFFIFLGI